MIEILTNSEINILPESEPHGVVIDPYICPPIAKAKLVSPIMVSTDHMQRILVFKDELEITGYAAQQQQKAPNVLILGSPNAQNRVCNTHIFSERLVFILPSGSRIILPNDIHVTTIREMTAYVSKGITVKIHNKNSDLMYTKLSEFESSAQFMMKPIFSLSKDTEVTFLKTF